MGRPGRSAGLASRSHMSHRIGAAGLVGLLMTLTIGASVATAAGEVTITTPYPGVAVAPGTKVSFDLSIETDVADRVDLWLRARPGQLDRVPLRRRIHRRRRPDPTGPGATVRLDVTLPDDAAAATQRIDVIAGPGAATDRLPLDIRVTPAAAGEVSLTTDFPTLKGPSTTAFTFNLTLHNDTSEDLTFGGIATGPVGWTVTPRSSSETQAANAIVKAGATTPVTVKAKPPVDVTPARTPSPSMPPAAARTAHADLSVEVTGELLDDASTTRTHGSTPRHRQARVGPDAGRHQNTGTAPVTGVACPRPPLAQGWTVEFDPETVDAAPKTQVNVIAHMTPSPTPSPATTSRRSRPRPRTWPAAAPTSA